MYHAHFGLREEPFGPSPDQRFFLPTEQHREAVATLLYSIQQRRGFSLLFGGPGLGKTSVIVQILHHLEGRAETAFLPHPYFDGATVLESILGALGIPASGSRAVQHRTFYEFLVQTRSAGKTCVVIFDEAQNIDVDTLEAIRMLSNFETPSEKLLQIIMAGQPRLAEGLARPELEQFRQRFAAVARLHPMATDAVPDYIRHRVHAAGGSLTLFAPEALEFIARESAGVPRNVNTICFNALTIAYALDHATVGIEDVGEAVRDLDLTRDTSAAEPRSPSRGRSYEAFPETRNETPVTAPALINRPDSSPSFTEVRSSAAPIIIATAALLGVCGTFLLRSVLKIF